MTDDDTIQGQIQVQGISGSAEPDTSTNEPPWKELVQLMREHIQATKETSRSLGEKLDALKEDHGKNSG